MIKVTGLWKNVDKNGKAYLSGYFGSAKILIFPNEYKKEEKHPDYILNIVENKKETERKSEDSYFSKEESPL